VLKSAPLCTHNFIRDICPLDFFDFSDDDATPMPLPQQDTRIGQKHHMYASETRVKLWIITSRGPGSRIKSESPPPAFSRHTTHTLTRSIFESGGQGPKGNDRQRGIRGRGGVQLQGQGDSQV
jgi:hypothetical protein